MSHGLAMPNVHAIDAAPDPVTDTETDTDTDTP